MSQAPNLGPGPATAPDLLSPDPAAGAGRARTKKAPNAFRTISEVADDLNIPQHVLRFWETKFPQVKPLKRGGGRRYYRPDDIQLLRGIADLLYTQCYTIKGVQRLLKDGGGKLGDNIPPASEAERAAAAAEVEAAPAVAGEPPAAGAAAVEPAAEPDDEPAVEPGREQGQADVLRRVLAELEALRSLLG